MYCIGCGRQFSDDVSAGFCAYCGRSRSDSRTDAALGAVQLNGEKQPYLKPSPLRRFFKVTFLLFILVLFINIPRKIYEDYQNDISATATAVSQANARSTSEARVREESEAREAQKQATATARAVLMQQTSEERSRFITHFKGYMQFRNRALIDILSQVEKIVSEMNQGIPITFFQFMFDSQFLKIVEKPRQLTRTFNREVPVPYESNAMIIFKDIETADEVVINITYAISSFIQSGRDRLIIRNGFEALRVNCSKELELSSDRIDSFTRIDNQ